MCVSCADFYECVLEKTFLFVYMYALGLFERAKRGKLIMHAAYITSGLHENSYALRIQLETETLTWELT